MWEKKPPHPLFGMACLCDNLGEQGLQSYWLVRRMVPVERAPVGVGFGKTGVKVL